MTFLMSVYKGVHRKRLMNAFEALLKDKRVVVLGIRDKYAYMDQELIDILTTKVSVHLRLDQ